MAKPVLGQKKTSTSFTFKIPKKKKACPHTFQKRIMRILRSTDTLSFLPEWMFLKAHIMLSILTFQAKLWNRLRADHMCIAPSWTFTVWLLLATKVPSCMCDHVFSGASRSDGLSVVPQGNIWCTSENISLQISTATKCESGSILWDNVSLSALDVNLNSA